MKEEIKQVIKGWYYYDKAFGWAEDEDDFVDSLATRLDKAIGIDEDTVWRKIVEFRSSGRKIIDASDCGDVAVLIAQSRPLKCEVES